MRNLDYIVVGTGRSGTGFMSKALSSAGIPCGHESIFGIAINTNLILCNDSPYKAESSWLAVPFLDSELLKDSPIIHVVRNPLDVISSYLSNEIYENRLNPYWVYQAAFEPWMYDVERSSLELACLHYFYWNETIENSDLDSRSYYFHRVEDDPQYLFKQLGLNLAETEQGYNHIKDIEHRVSWNKIMKAKMKDPFIKDRLKVMAKQYGYEIS